ncbi:efflux transporter outer membrane subunit [Rhodoferax sp. 4810]|nr:efflux transporter outer membrane subunit [Rhodoferax jenense]
MVTALVGCGSLQSPLLRSGADDTPTAEEAAANNAMAPALPTWWLTFNDPLLQTLIDQALLANPTIESSRGAVQQARALREAELASQRPQLSLSGSLQRNKADDASSVTARTGLDASWELDIFGANRSALANRDAEIVVALTNLRDVQLSLTAELALAYVQLRGLQAQLDIAQRNLISQRETLQITQWRAQAGLLTSLEVEQALTATAQTEAQIPLLRSNLGKARHSLAVLTGKTPTELDTLLQTVQPVPEAPAQVADVIETDRLRQRADLRAAEARITAALASVDATDAARWPKFKLGGSVGLTALTLAGLSNGASVATQVLASMAMPLLDGGAINANVKVQEASVVQARANFQSALLTALKEVEDAVLAWRNDQLRLVSLQQAATAAENAALLAQNRFESGLIDFQTVLQTQRTLLSAQDSLAGVQADLSSDYVRLVKAVGGAWQ